MQHFDDDYTARVTRPDLKVLIDEARTKPQTVDEARAQCLFALMGLVLSGWSVTTDMTDNGGFVVRCEPPTKK